VLLALKVQAYQLQYSSTCGPFSECNHECFSGCMHRPLSLPVPLLHYLEEYERICTTSYPPLSSQREGRGQKGMGAGAISLAAVTNPKWSIAQEWATSDSSSPHLLLEQEEEMPARSKLAVCIYVGLWQPALLTLNDNVPGLSLLPS
jgi:hypothetical protein